MDKFLVLCFILFDVISYWNLSCFRTSVGNFELLNFFLFGFKHLDYFNVFKTLNIGFEVQKLQNRFTVVLQL